MLASVAITGVREALSDEVSPYRHGDAELLRYLYRALLELWSLHPEGFMLDDFTVDAPEEPTTTTDDIAHLDPLWTSALVHNVASRVLAQDSEDENNRVLSAEHWKHWLEEI